MERENISEQRKGEIKEKFTKGEIVNAVTEGDKAILRNLLLKPAQIAPQEEIAKTQREVAIEREWWKDIPTYETQEQIAYDIEKEILVKINSDNNLQLIGRLQNPELRDWMPYLEKNTAKMVKEIGRRWREKMDQEGLPEEIRLAVSNLLVVDSYKREVSALGKLAVEGSGHSKGRSADIDGCGYFVGENEKVNPRQTVDYGKVYLPRVHQILLEVLKEMKNENSLNFIQEFADTKNQSFHIARSPEYHK